MVRTSLKYIAVLCGLILGSLFIVAPVSAVEETDCIGDTTGLTDCASIEEEETTTETNCVGDTSGMTNCGSYTEPQAQSKCGDDQMYSEEQAKCIDARIYPGEEEKEEEEFEMGDDIEILERPITVEKKSSFDWLFTFGCIGGSILVLIAVAFLLIAERDDQKATAKKSTKHTEKPKTKK